MPMPMPDQRHPAPAKPAPQTPPASGTQSAPMDPNMKMGSSMQMPMQSSGPMRMHEPQTFIEAIEHHGDSGTSAEPVSTPHPMLMTMRGKWMFMFHGVSFLTDVQQSSARGADKLFSANWLMPMAQRKFENGGTLTLRAMFSLEPATVTHRYYPLLFQQGETAFGAPINDGQHPHDFFMEVAALYDQRIGENTLLSFYAAPVGDPAIGPSAFAHRASASEDPLASLGHHMQDSTHIAYDVLTVGFTHRIARIEFSGFHGAEPDEHRWDIEAGRIDSWSTRLTVAPAKDWSMQYSVAHLTAPEALHPGEDTLRMTASLMYNRAFARGNWAGSIIWGRNRSEPSNAIANSYLAESTLHFLDRNNVWTRIENVDRTNELLLGHDLEPPGFHEAHIGRVQAYTFGYDREVGHLSHLNAALGAQVTFYGVPDSLKPTYGSHPTGAALFLRLRPF